MTYRFFGWVGVVLLCVLAVAGMWQVHVFQRVAFSYIQLQARINQKLDRDFSIQNDSVQVVRSVKILGVRVHIYGEHIATMVDIEGTLQSNRKFTMTSYADGLPFYAMDGFYLKPSKVEVQKFAYEGNAATELFGRTDSLYGSPERTDLLMQSRAQKVERWMTAVATSASIHALDKRSIYRPKDNVSGVLLFASLDSVLAEQDRIIATFGVWHLTPVVLLGFACLMAALVSALILCANPRLAATPLFRTLKTN